mmetsp:Transcript_40436/g.85438  ORF Transcript_40436/g.85438 Transcript_40436/m.85438 type:complete len:277 (+) Transcript_40436:1660-2490(+)
MYLSQMCLLSRCRHMRAMRFSTAARVGDNMDWRHPWNRAVAERRRNPGKSLSTRRRMASPFSRAMLFDRAVRRTTSPANAVRLKSCSEEDWNINLLSCNSRPYNPVDIVTLSTATMEAPAFVWSAMLPCTSSSVIMTLKLCSRSILVLGTSEDPLGSNALTSHPLSPFRISMRSWYSCRAGLWEMVIKVIPMRLHVSKSLFSIFRDTAEVHSSRIAYLGLCQNKRAMARRWVSPRLSLSSQFWVASASISNKYSNSTILSSCLILLSFKCCTSVLG